MTGAEDRILDDLGDTGVNAPPPFAQVGVQDRRQQRVGKADRPVLALDHPRGDRRVERVRSNPRALEQSDRRRAQRGGKCKRVASRRRERRDPRAHELFDRLDDRKRLKRVDVHRENAGELEREERIPTRPLVDPEQRLARERPPEPIAQEPMERPRAERPHDHLLEAVRTQRAFELRLMRALSQTPCEEKADRARVEPPQGERERTRRGRVEPLNVVDGDQNRPTFAQKPAARRALQPRACGDRRGHLSPPHGAVPPGARAVSASRVQTARRRRPSRADPLTPRVRGRAPPRPAATKGPSIPARARARRPLPRASTSRSPPRPRGRAWPVRASRRRRRPGGS